MKVIISLLLLLAGLAHLAHADGLPAAEMLITGCGEFVLASDLTLTVSADAQQVIHCDLKQTRQGPNGLPASITNHLNVSGGAGAMFLFCWQPAERYLWSAGAEYLDQYVMYATPAQATFKDKHTHYTLRDGRNLPKLPGLLAMALDKTFPR